MAVRIRMKKMGRAHRHFFRICAIDKRSPRDGKVLEELGTYDPMIADIDARAKLKTDRIDHWIGNGAQPSDKVAILIKKYGTNGTHLDAQRAAMEKLSLPVELPDPGPPASLPKSDEPEAETPAAEGEAPAEAEAKPEGDAPAEEAKAEAPAAEEAKADEAPAEVAPAEEAAKPE